jgi:GNAT superfamily N-acetyltransferase
VITVRAAETDADLEAWRRVRMAALPNERTQTVTEIRAAETTDRLLVIAELDGQVCGSGSANRSDLAGRASLGPRVLPAFRRRGIGTALLRVLADHVASRGYAEVGSSVDDPGSLAFAERFGFREVDRQVEQVYTVRGDEQSPTPPDGVTFVSVAERPELWRAAYDRVAREAFEDFAVDTPLDVSLEQWQREWLTDPGATFVAVSGDEVIGCAGLQLDTDRPGVAENALTGVRRDWRGRGVAAALKRTTLAWAVAGGIREVYTWTQRGNDDMRRLNERLGYVYRGMSISVRAPLPLPTEAATVDRAMPVSG